MALLQTERFLIQVRQTLLLKHVNLWQRKQMPNTYDNVKLDFYCRSHTGFSLTQ